MRRISALRLGSRARFQDRWSGRISAIEITEDWEAVNTVVESGFLLWRSSVRLPLSAVSDWTDDSVTFTCTSRQAFGHEVPPVAVPSRPIASDTPVSAPTVRIAGALIDQNDRKVQEVILSRRSRYLRIPVADVVFEGKTLALSAQPEALQRYRSDEEIGRSIHRAIRSDDGLTADEKRVLRFAVEGGAVTMSGNARVKNARGRAIEIVGAISGVTKVDDASHDDLSLETAVGLALDGAGIGRHSEIYARSSLGKLQLYGYVPSGAARDDAVRVVAAVAGVREVTSRLEVQPTAA
ncbi:MAG: BON domain-containing protein [Chloroflexi bacterium]|nr:BON domain-containing protein [Chloroflexota bacterium]MCI0842635.1 BON domain-containing protein [Chloroflexota bacterium]